MKYVFEKPKDAELSLNPPRHLKVSASDIRAGDSGRYKSSNGMKNAEIKASFDQLGNNKGGRAKKRKTLGSADED